MISALEIGIIATGIVAIISLLRKKIKLEVTIPLILIFWFFVILKLITK